MTVAFTCVLVAIVLPQIWAGYAKRGLVATGQYDNHAPRLQLERLSGPALRARWAEQNSYEALPGFVAAVLIAHLAGANPVAVDALAVVHVLARVAYGICYIRDLATLRSAVWGVGFLAVLGLFVAAYAA
ncbi:MAG: membrane protein [Porticoccaceae bacterium]|nr:MAG: membrane protein [Porticoccaceae bacterium]